jgi:uncharacterized protein
MNAALTLLAIQGALGAFDTLYYHEYKLRLPARPLARRELLLHALRDFAYASLFTTLGWVSWNGALAWALAAILLIEIIITLADFLEEDRTRKLPAGERVTHSIMGILYGLFLAFLVPELWGWSKLSTGFAPADHQNLAWLLTALGIGVLLSGIRDLVSSRRGRTSGPGLN